MVYTEEWGTQGWLKAPCAGAASPAVTLFVGRSGRFGLLRIGHPPLLVSVGLFSGAGLSPQKGPLPSPAQKGSLARLPPFFVQSGKRGWGLHFLCLKQQKCTVSQSGGKKFKIKVSAGLVPSEGCEGRVSSRPLSLTCRQPSSHIIFLLCMFLGPSIHFFLGGGHPSHFEVYGSVVLSIFASL